MARVVVVLTIAVGVALAAVPAALALSSIGPRYKGAMGLVPAHGVSFGDSDVATGRANLAVYHGGQVMRPPVTVHTIFWAPAGYPFSGPVPVNSGGAAPGYESLQQQFFTDVAHDSGLSTNIFSLLGQYPDNSGPNGYGVTFSAAADSIDDTDPYPARKHQCASPEGAAVCVTDTEITREVDKMIAAHDPSGRGLHDVWFVYLPPGVDECYDRGVCGTNAFGGYHSEANVGHGVFIYAVIIDGLIEFSPPQGSDPQGNPDGEATIDTEAHELVEAITNPLGAGWMDPNGNEVADKCENGPQIGTPLGFAPDGAPYDQLINGHEYLIQGIWSNPASGCFDRTSQTVRSVSLPSVSLHQFSPSVSGSIGSHRRGVSVTVALVRASTLVATATAVTRSDGGWGPTTLHTSTGIHGVGDDREGLVITYGKGGPKEEVIATGSGGNAFNEAGYTSWYDLDTGFRVRRRSVSIAPCTQVGVLGVRVGSRMTAPPVNHCGGETAIARVSTPPIGPGTPVTFSSLDNRAPTNQNPAGALVDLTVPLGEPGAIGAQANPDILLTPSGFPSCTADLRTQLVTCDGLVPRAGYTLTRVRAGSPSVVVDGRALPGGVVAFRVARGVRGGDVMVLRNAAHRTLTSLHVAHLRVAIDANQTVLAGGTCEPGDYWGRPVSAPPVSSVVGTGGIANSGTVCPVDGSAAGLPAGVIEQSDDLSGGLTRTAVPFLSGISPADDATMNGAFTALCKTYLPTYVNGTYAGNAPVELTIRPAGSSRVVFHSGNVNTAAGVAVHRLHRGVYDATWVVTDPNHDTRTYHTRFVEQ